MKKRRIFLGAAAVILGILSIFKFGEREVTAQEEGVTLVLYGSADDVKVSYLQKAIEMYEEQSGNHIDVQPIDTNNFNEIVKKKYQIGEIPDLLMCFGGYGLETYNPSENFVDFKDEAWAEDINEEILSQVKRGDSVYGVPFWTCSVSGCLYNKRIFEKYNLEIPHTQTEFDEICETLQNEGVQPVYMMGKDDWSLFPQYAMDVIFSDAQTLDRLNRNELTYTEIPQMRDMLEWYIQSAERGYFGSEYMSDTYAGCEDALGNGDAAMAFLWDTWLYTEYEEELYQYKKEDFGLMPAFMGTSEKGSFEGANCNVILASKKGENVETAKEFIRFLAQPRVYNSAFEGVYTQPIFQSMTTNKETQQYQESRKWIEEVGNLSVAAREIAGYSESRCGRDIQELLARNINIESCLQKMDEARIEACRILGISGF